MVDEAVVTKHSEHANRDEADAAVATTPGHLVERRAGGDYGPHSTALETTAPIFAGVGFDPNLEKVDAVPAGERMYLWHVPRGSGVHVDAIAGGAIAENDLVLSNGDGRLIAYAPATAGHDPGDVIGRATEAAAAAGDRFEVEV